MLPLSCEECKTALQDSSSAAAPAMGMAAAGRFLAVFMRTRLAAEVGTLVRPASRFSLQPPVMLRVLDLPAMTFVLVGRHSVPSTPAANAGAPGLLSDDNAAGLELSRCSLTRVAATVAWVAGDRRPQPASGNRVPHWARSRPGNEGTRRNRHD